MTAIKIIKHGMYTTIQDLGRYKYQKSGMPVAGAMDSFSLRVANMLAGNKDDEACIEITLLGPELQFDSEALISVTGGNLEPKINGKDMDMWSGVKVFGGDVLTFGAIKSGCRSYIAAKGGIDVPYIMGSKSTYVRGKIGGLEGRALKAGDEIKVGLPQNAHPSIVKLPEELIPSYNGEVTVRVVMGPQDEYFTKEGLDTFLGSQYEVTNEADRMGYRLAGPKINHKSGADIISDGITMGSVQVPGHGAPIIMMADRQTTGGYTKIATAITPDINFVGQLKPKDMIRFKAISIKEAHALYKNYINNLENIRQYIIKYGSNIISTKKFKVVVNSKEYELLVQEVKQ